MKPLFLLLALATFAAADTLTLDGRVYENVRLSTDPRVPFTVFVWKANGDGLGTLRAWDFVESAQRTLGFDPVKVAAQAKLFEARHAAEERDRQTRESLRAFQRARDSQHLLDHALRHKWLNGK